MSEPLSPHVNQLLRNHILNIVSKHGATLDIIVSRLDGNMLGRIYRSYPSLYVGNALRELVKDELLTSKLVDGDYCQERCWYPVEVLKRENVHHVADE
jgi:hypothetical protein